MSFAPERIADFLDLFDRRSPAIRDFPGCERLELVRSAEVPSSFMTISIWTSDSHLAAYRESDFFRETWSNAKTMFARRPEAESFELVRYLSPNDQI